MNKITTLDEMSIRARGRADAFRFVRQFIAKNYKDSVPSDLMICLDSLARDSEKIAQTVEENNVNYKNKKILALLQSGR